MFYSTMYKAWIMPLHYTGVVFFLFICNSTHNERMLFLDTVCIEKTAREELKINEKKIMHSSQGFLQILQTMNGKFVTDFYGR